MKTGRLDHFNSPPRLIVLTGFQARHVALVQRFEITTCANIMHVAQKAQRFWDNDMTKLIAKARRMSRLR
jgi:hypothetical protein